MINNWAGDSLMIALILISLASLILGMGLPVTASYIVLGTLSAPAVYNLIVDGHVFQVLADGTVPETARAFFMMVKPESMDALNGPMTVAAARSLMAAVPVALEETIREAVLPGEILTFALLSAHMIIFWLSQDSNVTPPVCLNPGVVDPVNNDREDQYISQIAMMLKYCDKFPNLGLRATKSNTRNGDVYGSAKRAIQLIQDVKGTNDGPVVMGQGICPNPPLAYDEEGLINLTVLVEEEQDITISTCTLSYMTGPESLMGIVIHDIAVCLAGAVYVQLLKPGTAVAFSCFSTMSDMRTMQPVYAGPEYLNVQIMFYEVCLHLGLNCVLCGCLADCTKNDYQGGFESCMTSIAPYSMTQVEEIWCYPGLMAAFAGGSFHKMIFDEEMLINCNRILQGLDLSFDQHLKEKLTQAIDTRSFLAIGDVGIYRKEQRITPVFDKKGINSSTSPSESVIHLNAEKIIKKRCASYVLPERSNAQQALLQKYLPTQCKY